MLSLFRFIFTLVLVYSCHLPLLTLKKDKILIGPNNV